MSSRRNTRKKTGGGGSSSYHFNNDRMDPIPLSENEAFNNRPVSSLSTSSRSRSRSGRKLRSQRHKRVLGKREFNPLLSISTIFGDQKSSIQSVKGSLCIDAIREGCIDAFQEIFKISHRQPMLIDPIAEKYFSISSDKLIYISTLLKNAEKQKRLKKFESVYKIYKEISDYLESEKDYKTALYFHKKSKNLAKESNNKKLEALVLENRGLIFERLGNFTKAMRSLEIKLDLTMNNKDIFTQEEQNHAKNSLIKVYLKVSENLKKENDYKLSCSYLQKCLKLANDNKELLGKISYQLGKVFEKLGDNEKAMEYQLMCKDISDELKDIEKSSKAEKHIGVIIQKTKDYDKAKEIYENFLKKARQSKNEYNIGKSCEKLGMILIYKNEFNKALPYFEENYKLAQTSNNYEWLNKARIKLGFARGNSKMNGFIGLIKNNDINALIDWKDKRNDVFKVSNDNDVKKEVVV